MDSLGLVVDGQIAVLAHALSVKLTVGMATLSGFLSPSVVVVAVAAHAIGVVVLVCMTAFGDIEAVIPMMSTEIRVSLSDCLGEFEHQSCSVQQRRLDRNLNLLVRQLWGELRALV